MRKLIIVVLTLLMSSTALADFKDVTWENIYKDAINNLQAKQIVSGYQDGTFGFDRDISRAEILKILIESKRKLDDSFTPDLENFKQACFNDVQSADWFSQYVCYAKSEGLVGGFAGNLFKPNQQVTVVEALKMAMRNFDLEYQETEKWYKGLVMEAAASNLIPVDTEYFHHNFKRGQMADLITRIENLQKGTLDDYLGDLKEVVVSWDTLKLRSNLYNDLVTACKAPSILRMLNQTAFYFQNGSESCLTVLRVYNNSLDDVQDDFGLTMYADRGYYTVFYKSNMQSQEDIDQILQAVQFYTEENVNYEAEAARADYKSLLGGFYVNFPAEFRSFKAVEYPLHGPNQTTRDVEAQNALWRIEAEDRFEDVQACRDYDFPSFMMFKIKVFYEYCKGIGYQG